VVNHPKSIYVKEAPIVPALDRWLARLFDPDNLGGTIETLVAETEVDEASVARAEAARRKLADCDDRLTPYRAALDGSGDPVLVAGWMSEVQADRLAAGKMLASCGPLAPRSPDEVRRLVENLG
jgi:site-specific DNA recombinase